MWLASCGDAADCCALPVKAKTWTGVQSAGSRNRSTFFHYCSLKKIWRTLETQINQDYYVGDMQKESHMRYNTEVFCAFSFLSMQVMRTQIGTTLAGPGFI